MISLQRWNVQRSNQRVPQSCSAGLLLDRLLHVHGLAGRRLLRTVHTDGGSVHGRQLYGESVRVLILSAPYEEIYAFYCIFLFQKVFFLFFLFIYH